MSRGRALFAVAVVAGSGAAVPAGADAAPRAWHVQAGAPPGGDGTRARPFGDLAAVQRASRAGDRIRVLRPRAGAGPLDGGIALQPGQRLVGAGPPVRKAAPGTRVPALTNTTEHLDGDAVRLASRARVRNLRIEGARRGGVYGRDVTRVRVTGLDVSGHNTSCTSGFHIPPFNVPSTAPGVGIPISDGLHNGWAAIMVDATRGRARVAIRRNLVRDADCGDGIDLRASGTARVRAVVTRNTVERLRQGDAFESVLAFGLQTAESARMTARLDRNRQADLGNEEDAGAGPSGADSEGVFVNPTGPSRMRVSVRRNTYRNDRHLGGFSANGLEFVSMGDGTRARLDVRDSSFSGTPGDVLEQLALGTNAHLRMDLRRVRAWGSTGFAESGFGNTFVIPGNNADCLIAASGGAGNVVDTRVRASALTGCANNGLTFGSAVANGEGPTEAISLRVSRSEITGNRGANLRVGNLAGLRRLEVRVDRTDLGDGGGATGSGLGNVSLEELGETEAAVLDFGGGALGSRGGNCLGGGLLAMAVVGYEPSARANWWGTPDGPAPGRTLVAGGALDAGSPLDAPPDCGTPPR